MIAWMLSTDMPSARPSSAAALATETVCGLGAGLPTVVGLRVLGRDVDVVAHHRCGEHLAGGVDDGAAGAEDVLSRRPSAAKRRGVQLVGPHDLDVDEAHHEDRDQREEGDHREEAAPPDCDRPNCHDSSPPRVLAPGSVCHRGRDAGRYRHPPRRSRSFGRTGGRGSPASSWCSAAGCGAAAVGRRVGHQRARRPRSEFGTSVARAAGRRVRPPAAGRARRRRRDGGRPDARWSPCRAPRRSRRGTAAT